MKYFLRNLVFFLLLTSTIAGLAYLGSRQPIQSDWSQNSANSLEPASIKVIQQLQGPVTITTYATEKDPELGDIRKFIRDFVSLYQRYKPDITLQFVDPEKQAEQTRAANIQLNGETVVEYAGRREHLTQINEQVLTSTLLRLAHSSNLTITYLDGHGERKLDGPANHDLGVLFGAKLKQNGYKINSVNLTIAQEVPHNTGLLVITHPRIDLLPGEIEKLQHYIKRGGNLLWLLDNEPLHGLEQLAEQLEIQLPAGMVIDPNAQRMGAPPTWSLGASYPAQHPVTRDFDLVTAIPNARPLTWNEGGEWQRQVLIEIGEQSWISHAAPGSSIDYDAKRDLPGPAVIALAQQRNINDKEQRIIVVGSADFLANSYAGNGGNIDLGINMINWLSHEEHLITIQPRSAKDSELILSKNQLAALSITFLIALPLLFITNGARLWWLRRKG